MEKYDMISLRCKDMICVFLAFLAIKSYDHFSFFREKNYFQGQQKIGQKKVSNNHLKS